MRVAVGPRAAVFGVALFLALLGAVAMLVVFTHLQARPAAAAPDSLIVVSDTVQGVVNLPRAELPAKACVVTSRFPRNSEVVFRARVWDPQTGEAMPAEALSGVQVMLPDGTTLDMNYGPHPPGPAPTDMYWTTAWLVPMDFPTGVLDVSIVATAADGRTGQFVPFIAMPSLLTITSEVLPDAPPPGPPPSP